MIIAKVSRYIFNYKNEEAEEAIKEIRERYEGKRIKEELISDTFYVMEVVEGFNTKFEDIEEIF